MLERIDNLPAGISGLRATGTVSRHDYDKVVEPLLADARRAGRRMRFLYHFTPEFDGFTAGAAWEDAQIGLRYLRLFERCAVVTGKSWIRGLARGVGTLLPCPVKVFDETEYDAAVEWLSTAASAVHVDHRLFPEHSVLLVEPRGELTVEDFDAIALTVDPWIESGNALNGLVVHTSEFPGWESIGSFVRHVQFIRDHHRKIRRVALSADGKLAKLMPALAEVFVSAEVQHFGYSEVDRAIEWAAQSGEPPAET
jgi:SpoIIAA-like